MMPWSSSVRGGGIASGYVRRTAVDAVDETGVYSISVYLAFDEPLTELCRGEPFLARYGRVRLSRVAGDASPGSSCSQRSAAPTTTSSSQTQPTSPFSAWTVASTPPVPNPGRTLER